MDNVVIGFEKVEVRGNGIRLSSEWSVEIVQDVLNLDGISWDAHDILNNMILDYIDEVVCSDIIDD